MFNVVIKSISAKNTYKIRQRVLWPSKPIEHCMLADDDKAYHFGAYLDDNLVGVASVILDGNSARLRKFAVMGEFQGLGIGSRVIRHTLEDLILKGIEDFGVMPESRLWVFMKTLI